MKKSVASLALCGLLTATFLPATLAEDSTKLPRPQKEMMEMMERKGEKKDDGCAKLLEDQTGSGAPLAMGCKNPMEKKGKETTGRVREEMKFYPDSEAAFLYPLPLPKGTDKISLKGGFGEHHDRHLGCDCHDVAAGTPIMAARDGKVTEVDFDATGWGHYVVIDHGGGIKTLYAHMPSAPAGVKAGSKVYQGEVIGSVGSTGRSTGPHLHFEVQFDSMKGKGTRFGQVDPQLFTFASTPDSKTYLAKRDAKQKEQYALNPKNPKITA